MRTHHPILQDVAERAGVSRSTVAAVLNGNDLAGQAARQRVWAALEPEDVHLRGPAMRQRDGRDRHWG